MRIFIILCFISVASSHKDPKCEGKHVRNVFNKMDFLEKGLGRPYQLSYYKNNHEIFYSVTVGNLTEDKFEIRRLQISPGSNITSEKIEGVENGFAIAINNDKNITYFGGSDGVYEYNIEKNTTKKIIDKHNIWDMFFHKNLYYITYPHQRLYKSSEHKEKKVKKWITTREKWIHEKIYQFAIDKDNDTFFTNETGLFMIKNCTEHRHHIGNETIFRCITLDNDGEAHFCGKNAIFVVNKASNTLEEIAYVKNIFGLTFTSAGHIIYSTPSRIVMLTPSLCKILNGVAMFEPLHLPKMISNKLRKT